ncbi:hypothetical protein BC938DRAFT_477185 [Jimgerdemannia flammicorona]|uniref:Sulfate transporter family-domain-containing protein n=1 Tax=Jimgerdemannia flammicorona TaxID=994334 RepID=A0A433PBD7_9FUNG|nr:hypothetical protein BC938DRAFT_477185 [Jimgerdemannia flammicorona]
MASKQSSTANFLAPAVAVPEPTNGTTTNTTPLASFSFGARSRILWQNFTLQELSGSLGDLGTLLPILISLSLTNQINLTSSLWFGGIWNILSGLMFQVPMCVQPMKAIAAVALASKMSLPEVMSAGMGVAAVVFLLGVTRTIHLVSYLTPPSIIKGIQLGTGITLILKAYDLISSVFWPITLTTWSDNLVWALFAFMFVFSWYYTTRVPTAFTLFLIGLVFSIANMLTTPGGTAGVPSIGFNYPTPIRVPTPEEFGMAFTSASLGQIPLTTLNSVIALHWLVEDLFPKMAHRSSTTKIAMSIGIMNMIGCWFGSIPYCHGSGGLAGQYRFGARTEVSIIFLGLLKLLVGVLFGSSLIGLLQFFPRSILAVMLFVSGAELAMASRSVNLDVDKDEIQRENYLVMLVTMGMLVAFKNDGIGFVAGCVAAVLLFWQRVGWREVMTRLKMWKRWGKNDKEEMPAAAPEIVIEGV